MRSVIVFVTVLGFIAVSEQQDKKINLLQLGDFQCEGKDNTNYTYVCMYEMDSTCTRLYDASSDGDSLISCSPNGQKTVSSIKYLAQSKFPAGAYYQYEAVYLITSGNLQGQFAYIKDIGLTESYLKKCSSVLGQSYTSTKSHVLLIADKLDLGVFLNPAGAFAAFRKTATSICKGQSKTF